MWKGELARQEVYFAFEKVGKGDDVLGKFYG